MFETTNQLDLFDEDSHAMSWLPYQDAHHPTSHEVMKWFVITLSQRTTNVLETDLLFKVIEFTKYRMNKSASQSIRFISE